MLVTTRLWAMPFIYSLTLYHWGNVFAQSPANPTAELANRSVKEFVGLIEYRCIKAQPNSVERIECVKDSARYWLAHSAARYEGIPDSYITGNTLAKDFLKRP